LDRRFPFTVAVAAIALAMIPVGSLAAAEPPASVVSAGRLGLYPARNFRLTDGICTDCGPIPSARWYFERETIAVPNPGLPMATFARGVSAFDDLRAWRATRAADAPSDYPPLVWVAAPQVIHGAKLAADASGIGVGETRVPIELVPKIPLNRSYFDASSVRFFAGHTLSARGTMNAEGHFVVRTLWPDDFRLGEAPTARTLPPGMSPALALRQLMREEPNGGAQSPFAAFELWRKPGAASDWRGRTVLAFIVNGAQGDDDEAHGGHFAIVTGRVADDGAIGDWLVNNFYTLDAESEKGILAAPVPLDDYQADLNSGQSYYRPSYMLVAVLAHERAAALVQSALGRVYNQFYRHQLVYYHPTDNCASISIDTLRALGWDIPVRGPSSRVLAWAGFPFIAAKERSIAKAKLAFDYLHTDQTRLMPAAALEEMFASLLALGVNADANAFSGGPLAQMLAQDLEALTFLRIPQIPSSRAWGGAPAVTTWEYRTMVPSDPSQAQIVPVPPRPFPDRLRDPDLLPAKRRPSDIAAIVWGVVSLVGIPWLLWRLVRRFRARRA
jgi:hypothetical protein